MDSRVFDYVAAIERTGSYAKAAKELYVTPQGMAAAIRRLESTYGVVFVQGRGDDLHLTEYGEVLAKHSASIRRSLAELEDEIKDLKKLHSNVITLGSVTGLLDFFPFDFEEEFFAELGVPVVCLQPVSYLSCLDQLLAGDCDYALLNGFDDGIPEGLWSVPLYSDYMFAWVPESSALAQKEFLDASDLTGAAIAYTPFDDAHEAATIESTKKIPGDFSLVRTGEMISLPHRVLEDGCVGLTTRIHGDLAIKGLRCIPLRDFPFRVLLCCRADRVKLDLDEKFIAYLQRFEKFYV